MASTKIAPPIEALPAWRAAGLRFHALSHFLKARFGEPVHKVSLDAGLTCPNVDGTVALGGCVFCDNRSFSPSRRVRRAAVLEQLEGGMAKVRARFGVERFIAYFQPASNTYAPLERVLPLWEAALSHPRVVGLAIGTRADCLPEPMLDALGQLARESFLSLEIGLQSIHNSSLAWMNRGHDYGCIVDAVERARGRGFHLGTHVILGLPGESPLQMRATAREVARLRFDSIKLHNLYVVERTPLADWYRAGQVRLLSREEYIALAVDFLELLPPECVIERTFGDAPPQYFIAPEWCTDRPALRRALDNELERRATWQGRLAATGG